MKNTTQKIVLTAMLAALICTVTIIVNIPSPFTPNGNINLGDSAVLLAALILPTKYAFFAASIGSALADVYSGFVMYVPATFIIKGLMAIVISCTYNKFSKLSGTSKSIISGLLGEIIMVLGYYAFEGAIYGFIVSLPNIIANAIQGVCGVAVGVLLLHFFKKANFTVKK